MAEYRHFKEEAISLKLYLRNKALFKKIIIDQWDHELVIYDLTLLLPAVYIPCLGNRYIKYRVKNHDNI